jgi:hypothetical protein
MNAGEAWTPVCVPGCSEEYMLHVYTCFKAANLGMIMVCTDHDADYFLECTEYRQNVFDYLNKYKMYAGPKQPSLYEVIDRITINMHEITDMKEI